MKGQNYFIAFCVLLPALFSGCASRPAVDPYQALKTAQAKAEGSQDIYKMIEGKMQHANAFDWTDQPYIPIRTQEKIHPFIQWDHVYDKDKDIYIGKNLVWVVIEPTKWYIEDRIPQYKLDESLVPYQKQGKE